MQHSRLLAVLAVLQRSAAIQSNPVQKTIDLLDNLLQTITRNGEDEQKAYEDFFAWCDDSTHQKEYEIKSATKQKSKLEAAIAEATSDIEDSNTQITHLASEISSEEGKLKTASELREREKEEFEASERELMSAVDMLNRAIGVLEQESQGGASFVQGAANTKTLEEVMLGLTAVVDAASFIGDDSKEKLMSLIQSVRTRMMTLRTRNLPVVQHTKVTVEALLRLWRTCETKQRRSFAKKGVRKPRRCTTLR